MADTENMKADGDYGNRKRDFFRSVAPRSWISVWDGAPALDVPVLVTDGQTITAARWNSVGWVEHGFGDGEMDFHMPDSVVTHWMPLPPMPAKSAATRCRAEGGGTSNKASDLAQQAAPGAIQRYNIDAKGLPFADSAGVWVAYEDCAALQQRQAPATTELIRCGACGDGQLYCNSCGTGFGILRQAEAAPAPVEQRAAEGDRLAGAAWRVSMAEQGMPVRPEDYAEAAPVASAEPFMQFANSENRRLDAAVPTAKELRMKFVAIITGATSLGENRVYDLADALITESEKFYASPAAHPANAVETLDDNAALRKLAFRTLWLAYVWNDHNFKAAHIEARETCASLGIHSFDEANAWIESVNNRCAAPSPANTGEADNEIPVCMSTFGTKAACDAEHARRAALRPLPAGELLDLLEQGVDLLASMTGVHNAATVAWLGSAGTLVDTLRAAPSPVGGSACPVRVEQLDAERTRTTYRLCTCGGNPVGGSADLTDEPEYFALRLKRVARAAGVKMFEDWSNEQVASCAVTILGDIARKLEASRPAALAAPLTNAEQAFRQYVEVMANPCNEFMAEITVCRDERARRAFAETIRAEAVRLLASHPQQGERNE